MFPVSESQRILPVLFSYYQNGTYTYWNTCELACFFRRRKKQRGGRVGWGAGGCFVLALSLRACNTTDNNTSLDEN